jgi:hypothetical protein
VGTGTKEVESSTGRVWATKFHNVMARSRLAHVFESCELFISLIFQIFWGGRGKPRILNRCIRGHDCTKYEYGASVE